MVMSPPDKPKPFSLAIVTSPLLMVRLDALRPPPVMSMSLLVTVRFPFEELIPLVVIEPPLMVMFPSEVEIPLPASVIVPPLMVMSLPAFIELSYDVPLISIVPPLMVRLSSASIPSPLPSLTIIFPVLPCWL